MKTIEKLLALLLTLCLCCGLTAAASASTFTDAHGNVIELDDSLEAYTEHVLYGAENAARKGETNLGDLWTDALRWFAVSGAIDASFEEDDVTAGNTKVDADADHIVALWNGGNLRADVAEGKFGADQLAEVLPYPNKVAVVYMTGAQLLEALEAASQALPCTEETADACASFMQVSGLTCTVDTAVAYDKGEAWGDHWFRANSLGRVTIEDVNGQPFDAEAIYAVITSNANFNGMDSSYIFKEAAEAHGMKWNPPVEGDEASQADYKRVGYSRVSLKDEFKEEVYEALSGLREALTIYRDTTCKGKKKSAKKSNVIKYMCPCCGNSVRATKEVLIMCMDCEEKMMSSL